MPVNAMQGQVGGEGTGQGTSGCNTSMLHAEMGGKGAGNHGDWAQSRRDPID